MNHSDQQESSQGRAAAEDLAWIEDEILCESYEGNTPRVERYRRILDSLRSPPVPVADRERIETVLREGKQQIAQQVVEYTRGQMGSVEDTINDAIPFIADRLLRILGGFPVATCPGFCGGTPHSEPREYVDRDGSSATCAPPAPVLQEESRAWLIETEHGGTWTVYSRESAETRKHDARLPGVSVTPLYALRSPDDA